eukprot:EG_transcript_13894
MPSTSAPPVPCRAIVAPSAIDATKSVTGTVLVDQHEKDVAVVHEQLRYMTLLETADHRHLCITAHIADGTWGSVYAMCEAQSTHATALKVIPIEGANVDSAYAEIELLKQLSHPHIVKYHSHFTQRINDIDCLCIELGLCSKGTLERLIQTRAKAHHRPGFSAAEVRDFVSQLASALAYVHSHGHLHGDLCPENVLLAPGKQLRLTSFGSPLWIDRMGRAPRTITGGCKTYAPPEWAHSVSPHRALKPQETPLPSYDMWGLGCILSELVTLKLLRSDRRLVRTALAAHPQTLQAIAEEVAAEHRAQFSELLGKLLERDPDARLSAPETLQTLQATQPHKTSCLLTTLRRPFSCLRSVCST